MPLRLALVYRHFNTKGSLPRFHVELTRGLSRRGHEVHVYSIAATRDEEVPPGAIFHEVPASNVSPGRFDTRELASFAWHAKRLLKKESFDAIHTRLPSVSVGDIVHVHGVFRARHHAQTALPRFVAGHVRHPSKVSLALMEWSAARSKRVARFHVDSELVRDDLQRYYGVDSALIEVLEPGVNLSEFRPGDQAGARRKLGVRAGFTVLFCGHDFARKGLDRLVEAMGLMREEAHLLVVGSGDNAPYAARARILGVETSFVGGVSAPALAYQAADVFVLPTRTEMWGMTVVESMACGVTPIVTRNAGVAKAVDDGKTGFVVNEAFAAEELAALLDRLAREPDVRVRVGSAGVDAARRFDWELYVARVEEDLAAVAAGLPPSGQH